VRKKTRGRARGLREPPAGVQPPVRLVQKASRNSLVPRAFATSMRQSEFASIEPSRSLIIWPHAPVASAQRERVAPIQIVSFEC